MRPLPDNWGPYEWAPSTDSIARLAGIDPIEVVRFDGNVRAAPLPSSRPGTIARALADINTYPHGGYIELTKAIARYAEVSPANVVLGAGADDLIMLTARSFAGPGDHVTIADDPTYPLYRVAAAVAGATTAAEGPVVTFCCRPNNPTGALDPLPDARPLVVDEAYYEYAGETAAGLIGNDVIVLRTFSKAFGLAGARVGYALAGADTAAELNGRQCPAPLSTVSAELAVAALARPPDVRPEIEERERLRSELQSLGIDAAPSRANFLLLSLDEPGKLADALLRAGIAVRLVRGGVRVSVRDRADDDLLLAALGRALDGQRPEAPGRRARVARATTETRVRVRLGLDGSGLVCVQTGAGLYDHLLEQLAFHAGLDLLLEAAGDRETGDHHTAEDSALALGEALDRALGERRGIARYGHAIVPMDESLGRAAIDLGGRPFSELDIRRDPGLAGHVLGSFAQAGRLALHVTARGQDSHHVAEAAFKAVGRALRSALQQKDHEIPSSKGTL